MNSINISIDDVTPHPQSSVKVLDRCFSMLQTFPLLKFTLFIPTCYTRQGQESYPIISAPEFVDKLKSLPKDTFEFGYHGHYHGVLNENSNNEFATDNYGGITNRIKTMLTFQHLTGLTFSSIFRPPAWRMTPSSIKAIADAKIEILSLSKDDYALVGYAGADKTFPKVVYYDCNPPFKPLVVQPTLSVVYHACEWDKNYFSKEREQELINFLTINQYQSVFMKELWVNQTTK